MTLRGCLASQTGGQKGKGGKRRDRGVRRKREKPNAAVPALHHAPLFIHQDHKGGK